MLPFRSSSLRFILFAIAGCTLLLTAACGHSRTETKGPLVLAASSMQDALTEAAQAWKAQGHPEPVLSFAATSALARQVETGAPADLFVSADEKWMDDLEGKGLVRQGSRRDLVANTLVVIAPAASEVTITSLDSASLAAALGDGRLALADPEAVPAGRYAKQALSTLEAWDGISSRVIPAENVRLALALVARGEAALGIVYATDAKAEPAVRVVHTFAPASHDPIVYPAALLKASRNGDAAPFLAFLTSGAAAAIFRKHGFSAPEAP